MIMKADSGKLALQLLKKNVLVTAKHKMLITSTHLSLHSYWAETEPSYAGKCLNMFRRQSNRKWVASNCDYREFLLD